MLTCTHVQAPDHTHAHTHTYMIFEISVSNISLEHSSLKPIEIIWNALGWAEGWSSQGSCKERHGCCCSTASPKYSLLCRSRVPTSRLQSATVRKREPGLNSKAMWLNPWQAQPVQQSSYQPVYPTTNNSRKSWHNATSRMQWQVTLLSCVNHAFQWYNCQKPPLLPELQVTTGERDLFLNRLWSATQFVSGTTSSIPDWFQFVPPRHKLTWSWTFKEKETTEDWPQRTKIRTVHCVLTACDRRWHLEDILYMNDSKSDPPECLPCIPAIAT